MRISRRAGFGGMALLCLAAQAGPASAQAGSVYGFGDSLIDNGNLYRLLHGFTPVSPPYYSGRFSNGPVVVEYLPALTRQSYTDLNDVAFGGALTGHGNLGSPLLPGTADEIDAFQAAGRRFGPRDNVVLWAGGNDFFRFFSAVLPTTAPDQVQNAAAQQVATTESNIGTDIVRLAGLGGRNFVVLGLPDLGGTPSLNTPQTKALASQITLAHDAALQQTLAGVRVQTGANIYYINTYLAGQQLAANPARFGIANTVDACTATSCVNGTRAQQNTYQFWDNVHPTTGIHNYLAQVIGNQLGAAQTIGGQAELVRVSAANFTDTLAVRLDARREAAGGLTGNGAATRFAALDSSGLGAVQDPNHPLSVYIQGGYAFGSRGDRENRTGFGYDLGSLVAGGDYRIADSILAGVAFGYGAPSARFNGGGGKLAYDAYQFGAYASFFQQAYFADVSVAYGIYNTGKSERPAIFNGETIGGHPNGHAVSVAGSAGYVLHAEPVSYGPIGGIAYTNVGIGSYSESGDPLLTQHVGSQSLDSFIAHAGGQIAASLPVAAVLVKPYAALQAEREFMNGQRALATGFTSASTLGLTTRIGGATGTYGRANVGVSSRVTAVVSAVVDFGTTFGRPDGDDRSVIAKAKVTF